MVIIVTCRIPGDKALANRLARAAAEELDRYFQSIVAVEWILEPEGAEIRARGRIHSRSGYYRGEARGFNMQEAIQQVLHKLETQRRRKKEKRVSRRRRPVNEI